MNARDERRRADSHGGGGSLPRLLLLDLGVQPLRVAFVHTPVSTSASISHHHLKLTTTRAKRIEYDGGLTLSCATRTEISLCICLSYFCLCPALSMSSRNCAPETHRLGWVHCYGVSRLLAFHTLSDLYTHTLLSPAPTLQ